ncbi:S8 family serine peptidase [Carboxylicivirga sediminis]|uniref:S8 family serine peptidase n=1 Tax=Carboxylicivirga sediminis TaxID=2006564 RepID=A0A941IYA8_9BACT|nr:S8 family serine peptidase [Carboxylicivirga sediminis]MBR8535617.1 S8 family serine peptidase [Carboxylicivirga sediminis]
MKKNLHAFSYHIGVIVLALLLSISTKAQNYENGVLQGAFRVKLKPHLLESVQLNIQGGQQVVTTGVSDIDLLNARFSAVNMQRIFPFSPRFEAKHQKYGLHLWYEVSIANEASTQSAIQAYSALASVEVCEPIREVSLIHPMNSKTIDKSQQLKAAASMPFNDPYLPMQWHYNNTGQTNGIAGADMNAFEAWKVTAGSNNVIVSIHDEGVDVKHEDLKDAMWVNEAELNGEPNVDDDGNGFKDDIYGFNFADNMGDITPGHHGSHVAGTVGAVNNNGIGVAGVAGGTGNNDGARIMSCQILGGVSQGNLPNSFVYAADNGAVISQNSWGYNQPGYIEQAILDAIDYFIKEAGSYAGSPMKGGVVIFAAGNDNYDGQFYPGYYDEVIAVSALGSSNEKASYSNYGTWVDLAAPGGDTGDDANMTDNQAQAGYSNGVLSCYAGNTYGYMDGTSMACPHVSGIAALVVSKYGSESFTNNDLKRHLLTAVNDIYEQEGNVPYVGKLGNGAIDAALALKNNTGDMPDAITDLSMSGLAQDFAVLEWSVPVDNDDTKPWEFEVLYSEEAITHSTLEFARSLQLRNENEPGEKVSIEVPGLEALTEYHFAVRSIDRWGNYSDFSNPLTATTNAGPDAQIDPTTKSLHFDVDASTSALASMNFNILNKGEGLLRWMTENHHVSSIDAYSYANNLRYPNLKQLSLSKQANIQTYVAGKDMPISTYSQTTTTDHIRYFDTWRSMYYIGEEDTSYTNSAAIRFFTSRQEGFNMTHVEALLRNDPVRGPMILEIREGADLLDSKLLYAQEIDEASDYGFTNIQLEEQLFFPYGTHFWIVVHVPSGNRYPLGAGVELQPELSEMCYMSLNGGKSWARFEDLYYNNLVVWAFTPISKLKPEQEYLSLTPSSGETLAEEASTVDVSVDMSQLVNGTYRSNIVVYTNETDSSMLRVPTSVNLSGHPFNLQSESIIDCGSVILGNAKVIPVTIDNIGLGNFSSAYIEITNPDFKVKSNYLGKIAAKSGIQFNVVFEPSAAGNANAVARIYNYNGDEYIFNLFGVAAEPPVMEISPATLTYDDLTIGDEVQGEFTITNTGKYPLEYFLPAFVESDQTVTVDEKTHLFGYAAQINEGGLLPNPPFVWTDISNTGTKVEDYDRTKGYFYYPVELDFEFPFFGKRENSLYITNWGMVTFDQNSSFNVWPPSFKLADCPDRFISVMGRQYDLSKGGAIYYQSFGDKFVVQYDKVVWESFDWWSGESLMHEQSFQIVIYNNGNIEFIYNTLDGLDAGTLSQSFIAIEDQLQSDGYFITDIDSPDFVVSDQTVIRFVNPGLGLVTELTNPQGKIQVGESVTLAFKASTDVLNVERHLEKLSVLSNDPLNNPGIFTIDMNITGGGLPNVEVSQTAINFGQVFQGDVVNQPVWVINNGRATSSINSVVSSDVKFTIDGVTPQEITPGRKLPYVVMFNTSELGVFNANVVITTSEGDELIVAVTGEVIEAPVMDVSVSSITETVAAGNQVTVPFTIANTGGNDLHVAAVGADWLTIDKKVAPMSEIKDFTYYISTSDEENGPDYNWVDIVETGVAIPEETIYNNYWVETIELPFEFNFYGQAYSSVYVGGNGVLSFNSNTEDYWFGGELMPSTNEPNNLVAALWGLTGPNMEFFEDAGIYYQVADDKLIVQYHMMVDGFGMSDPTSCQIILYANGNIKLQYEWHNAWVTHVASYSQAGLENADGTEAVVYSAYEESRIHDDLAVVFTPVEKHVVAPGSSMDFVATLDAAELFAGTYTTNLGVLNNTPGTGRFDIPVTFNVTGEAVPIAPSSVDFGSPMVVEQPNAQWYEPPFKAYEIEFEIKNEGTKRFEILGFDLSKMSKMIQENSTYDKIQAYTLASAGWGEPMVQWVDINMLPYYDWMTGAIPLYVEPMSSLKLKANYMPDETLNAEGTALLPLADILVINTDMAEMPNIEIAFTASPVLPPVMSTSAELVSVYAQDDNVVETHTVVLDNSQGNSDLVYTIKMDYERNAHISSAVSPLATNEGDKPALIQSTHEQSIIAPAAHSADEYNRILSYSDATEPESKLGLGGSYQFGVATRYMAPENGFNLTHVQTWYTPEEWLDSKITVEILAGSQYISQCEVIYTEDFQHAIEEADFIGKMLTFELTQTQIFYPNEPFFVVFKYPTAVKYPQGIVEIGETVDGRFSYNAADVWYDLGGTDFATKGWMTTAIEAEYKTGLWVELQNQMQGVVPAGQVVDLDFLFSAIYADNGDNRAVATISSNDPFNSMDKINLHMLRNRAPEIISPDDEVSVIENEVMQLEIAGIDHEGNEFDWLPNQMPEFITTQVIEGNKLALTIEPGYEAAGVYQFSIEATDAFNNSATLPMTVNVINNNRAPVVAKEIAEQDVIMENGVVALNLIDFINDPDNEQLSFELMNEDNAIIEVFVADNRIMLNPLTIGQSLVSITATDPHGATVVHEFIVTVRNRTGIDDSLNSRWMLYPNPATQHVTVSWGADVTTDVYVRLLSATGNVLANEVVNALMQSEYTIMLDELTPGVYFVELIEGQQTFVFKVIKQ